MSPSAWQLVSFLLDRGAYDDAERLYTEALAILNKMVGEDHHYVGGIMGSLANVNFHQSDYQTADSLYRRSLAILGRTLPEGHVNLASPLLGLGKTLLKEEKPAEAEPLIREGLKVREAALPAGHWQIAQAQALLGLCLADQGCGDEAIFPLESSLRPLAERRDNHAQLADEVGERLIDLYNQRGETVQADSVRAALASAR